MGNGMEHQTGTVEDPSQPTHEQQSAQGWHADERQHRRHERYYWGTIIFLTVLAVAGAGASAIFAYRAADAALGQVGVAKDTEQRQLRAYLHISHGPMQFSDSSASAEVWISHSGQTPAYKIKLSADILVGHFPLPAAEDLNLSTSGIPNYDFGALYGTEPIKQKISMPVNSNDAIEIQKRSRDRLAGGLQVFLPIWSRSILGYLRP